VRKSFQGRIWGVVLVLAFAAKSAVLIFIGIKTPNREYDIWLGGISVALAISVLVGILFFGKSR
jgi:hypothetical protein